jgi:hypothetical protein
LGGKWKKVEKNLFLLLPLATKLWIYLHLPFPSFQKADSDDRGFLFSPNIIFNSILRILVPTSFLRRKKMMSLSSWEQEGKYNGNLVIVLEEWR